MAVVVQAVTDEPETHTAADVSSVCDELFGVVPRRVAADSNGITFRADLDGRAVVVKFARQSDRATPLVEAWVYEQCRVRGIRVPEVLGTLREPECVVITALEGRSLWDDPRPDEPTAAWQQAGIDLRRLHEIAVAGFGPLLLGPDGVPRGRSTAWCPFVDAARHEGLGRLADRGILPTPAARSLERRLDEFAAIAASFTEPRLLHGDMEGGHIFVAGSSYTGIIDFDQAQAGDPRWDLARVPLWDGEDALDALLVGYGEDAVTPGERRDVLPLYLFAFVMHHAMRVPPSASDHALQKLLRTSRYERLL